MIKLVSRTKTACKWRFVKWEAPMENYIVRIYRRDEKDPQKIVGVMEEVGVKGKKPFKSFDELSSMLVFPARERTDEDTGVQGEHPDSPTERISLPPDRDP